MQRWSREWGHSKREQWSLKWESHNIPFHKWPAVLHKGIYMIFITADLLPALDYVRQILCKITVMDTSSVILHRSAGWCKQPTFQGKLFVVIFSTMLSWVFLYPSDSYSNKQYRAYALKIARAIESFRIMLKYVLFLFWTVKRNQICEVVHETDWLACWRGDAKAKNKVCS